MLVQQRPTRLSARATKDLMACRREIVSIDTLVDAC
jgi:hypothetical protein